MKKELVILKNGKMLVTSLELVREEKGLGVCYILDFGLDVIKIGKTSQLKRRLKNISDISPIPIIRIYATVPCVNYTELETYLHRKFKAYRKHGEYFTVAIQDVITAVNAFGIITNKAEKQTDIQFMHDFVNRVERKFIGLGIPDARSHAIEFVVLNCEDFGINLPMIPLTEDEELALS